MADDRNSERLTAQQTVPAEDIGGAAYWQHHASRWNTFVGMDTDDAHGISNDYSYSTRRLTRSGGTLLQHGIFGQADVRLGPAALLWRHPASVHGPRRYLRQSERRRHRGRKQFRFRASGYRSFRAPTLNELYRSFRVGNALTQANAGLVPEELVGVETGVDWIGENDRLSLTLFRNDLSDLIVNATLNTTPNLILRQRQNQSKRPFARHSDEL